MAKTRRKRKRRRSRSRTAAPWTVAFGLAIALLWSLFGDQLRDDLALGGAGLPDKGHGLRVVTWNLRNFAGDPEKHDLPLLDERLAELSADIIAVQEIKDPAALEARLPQGYRLRLSSKGGRGRQLLGIAYDARRVSLIGEPIEYPALSHGGRVRPGFAAHLRGRDGGPDLWVLVVHLKAMPDGVSIRRQQWKTLVEIANELEASDRDLLILGDFNTTGPKDGSASDEIEELSGVLSTASLRRIPSDNGCTAYWDGRRRDAIKEPSELDLVWARDLAESLTGTAVGRAWAHCDRHTCQTFRSTKAYPEPDYAGISDHCPVVLDLDWSDDD